MSESLFFQKNYKKVLKTYIKIRFYFKKIIESLVYCEWKSKYTIRSFALLSWTTWANRSRPLFCHERPERFSHCRSFVMRNLSDSLTVAHLSWAIWVIHSQSLICPERSERMSEFPTLPGTSQNGNLPKTFLQIIHAGKWLVRHLSTSHQPAAKTFAFSSVHIYPSFILGRYLEEGLWNVAKFVHNSTSRSLS